jgi:predicted acetyltransferase
MTDREAARGPVTLADGTEAARLPSVRFWLWDGEFCGSIGFRWQVGTEQLPPHYFGHIGYTVVPWKRRLGYATEALRQILPYAKAEGLSYVELTTDPDNKPSNKVIEANGGVMIERFVKSAHYGSAIALRWHIHL